MIFRICKKYLSLAVLLATLPIASCLLLASAWLLEIVFGWAPCILCWYQRSVLMGTLVFGFIAWLIWSKNGPYGFVFFCLILCALLYLLGVGIGLYHSGIEWGFWVRSCTPHESIADTTALLQEYFQRDEQQALCLSERRLLWMPLPFWNVLACGALFLASMMALALGRREEK